MNYTFKWFATAISLVSGYVVSVFGTYSKLFYALLILMLLDYISGVIKSVYIKDVNSKEMFKGIFKKILILFIVLMSITLQSLVLNNSIILISIVLIFYICNECLSILENCGHFLPIPNKIKEVLTQLQYGDDYDK